MEAAGDPCAISMDRACAGHAQKKTLRCQGGVWVPGPVCSATQYCDTTPGGALGTCREAVPGCVNAAPGDPVCINNDVQTCGPDLVTSTPSKTCVAPTATCTNGKCSNCVAGATECTSNTERAVCGSDGSWGVANACPFACVGKDCGGVCVPGATDCAGTTPRTCGGDGQWVTGPVTAGVCGAACTAGASASCGAAFGSKGVCATGTVTCQANGSWSPCPIMPTTELCNPGGADENCNGDGFDGCACQNGSTQACGPCGNGSQSCSNGTWGGCSGGTSPQTYYRDADGDGWCNPGDAVSSCTQPGGYIPCSCSSNCDCLDSNGWVQGNCSDFTIDGPSYGKGCCGGPEDKTFSFDCGSGWHSVGCDAIRQSGGSQGFWITSWDSGVQAGNCTVHYSLQGVEGVTGFGRVTCRPDGL